MYIPVEEQETVVQIDRQTKMARIYTTDSRVICKLDKIYDRFKVHKQNRKIVGVEYQVPENMITFRSKSRKCTLTEAQKKKATERIKNVRKKKG